MSVALAAPVRSETETGFRADVELTIRGEIETFRFTLPANPLRLFSNTVNAARLPCGTVIEGGLAPMVKSGEFD